MRTEYVECKYRYQAEKECPWASKIAKCGYGYMCFESWDDYNVWKKRK